MKIKITILLSIVLFKLQVKAQTFVKVNYNCGFSDTWGSFYKPLVCNYAVDFIKDYNTSGNPYYVSPHRDYSSLWGCWRSSPLECNGDFLSIGGIWSFTDDANNDSHDLNDKAYATAKLTADLARIKSLGFTEIRLCGAGMINPTYTTCPSYNKGTYMYPTGESIASGGSTYFSLLDNFMTQANNAGLRVIFLLGGKYEYTDNINYKNYIASVAAHYKNNLTIMAYDLCNEPSNTIWPNYSTSSSSDFNKYNFTKLFTDWNSTVKANDPNHLTTMGLWGPVDISFCDPTMLPIDFASFHAYSGTNDLTKTYDKMDSYYYWCGKTMNIPWIIGETSYPATDNWDSPNHLTNLGVGSLANQNAFAVHTLQKSVDCNCKGYSWWQYQDVVWGPNSTTSDNFMGLYYQYTGPSDYGQPKTLANTSPSSPFNTYNGLTQTKSNCGMPTNYYTAFNGTNTAVSVSGTVKDNSNTAIANAVVYGKDGSNVEFTFTDASGHFTLNSTTSSSISQLLISAVGYSTTFTATPVTNQTYTLTKVNYNGWEKEYTNVGDNSNGKFHVIDGTGSDWNISSSDKYYKGDFNGDGQQDLLCVQNTGGSTDRMTVLSYAITTYTYYSGGSCLTNNVSISSSIRSGWSVLWDNGSNSSNGGGIYPYRGNLTIGNFDGTGGDDVLSIGSGGSSWTTWFTYAGGSTGWNWMDSDYGTTGHPMSAMSGYNTNVIAGKFYGGTQDAILGIAYPSSYKWITTFQIISGQWTWKESNGGVAATGQILTPLNNYLPQFIPGDFDGDGITEILGNATPTGGMAVFKSNGGSPWVTKWSEAYGATTDMFPYRNNLQVGNFDADPGYEILGFNNNYCVAFDLYNYNSGTSTWSWNVAWDGTYNSVISDWSIPTNYTNGKYLFLNTDKNFLSTDEATKRQQLLAINSSTQVANLYSFAPVLYTNIEGSYPCTTLRMANPNSTGISENNKSDDGVKVYPNPSNGNFIIETNTNDKQVLQVFDVNGKIVLSQTINGNVNIDASNLLDGIYNIKIANNDNVVNKRIVIAR